jgi:alkaline phosphatase D
MICCTRIPYLFVLLVMLCLMPPLAVEAARSERGTLRVMQGPMIGAVSPNEVLIWVRLSGEFPVQIEYDETPAFAVPRKTEAVTPSKERDDLTAVLRMTGLEADTVYYYRVISAGRKDPYLDEYSVRTAPDGPAKFSVSFGSCPRIQRDPLQPIWLGVAKAAPDVFFWIGDNIYGDTLDPDILAEEYRRQLSVPYLRPLLASIPQLAVWDDHDFALNDHDRTNPIKEEALVVFRRYWANPSYGLPETPGVFFRYHYGGVDFFFLDNRYYRDPNTDLDGPEKTHLGGAQMEWLKQGLLDSRTSFKVLISGGGWSKAKGPGGDSWAGYLHERNDLFDFIRDREISGVLLISGDTHTGEFNAIPWSEHGGYDFYDLGSSPLAQNPGTAWRNRHPEIRIRSPYEGVNAGWMAFDMTASPPVVELNLIDENGEAIWAPVTLSTADLQNGAATAEQNAQGD